jgi:hypothetical protein
VASSRAATSVSNPGFEPERLGFKMGFKSFSKYAAAAAAASRVATNSGATNAGVPTPPVKFPFFDPSNSSLTPKSVIFTVPSVFLSRLSGFKSRCATPLA